MLILCVGNLHCNFSILLSPLDKQSFETKNYIVNDFTSHISRHDLTFIGIKANQNVEHRTLNSDKIDIKLKIYIVYSDTWF